MRDEELIKNSLIKLESWIENEKYKGYDPYDFLNSPIFNKGNPKIRFYAQQFGKFFPINLRPIFHIKKMYNPKALAIISLSYLRLNKIKEGEFLLNKLKSLKGDKNYYAWGYNFPWQSRNFYLKAYEPNAVVTSTVALSFIKYYEKLNKVTYLRIAESAAEYLLKNLVKMKDKNGLCFSYTKYDNSKIINVNLFVGALLANLFKHTRKKKYKDIVKEIVKFTKKFVPNDGKIIYGYRTNGEILKQLDFHQGFDILLMNEISKSTKISLKLEIKKALKYYRKMFNENGIARYRNEKKWPADIHNQSVGILTFSNFKEYSNFAIKIARWTIKNMQSPQGYFYTFKWPFFTNKIPYMRWGQVWMMLALSNLLNVI